jgi:hypothetical protein
MLRWPEGALGSATATAARHIDLPRPNRMPQIDIAALRRAVREDRYLISRHVQERMGLRKITHADLKYVVATGDVVDSIPTTSLIQKPCSWRRSKTNHCTSLAPLMATVFTS